MITVWPSLYRPADGRAVPFSAVVARARAPHTYASKDQIPRWSPGEFARGYRCLDAFQRAMAVALDFDAVTTKAQIESAFGYLAGLAHTTWTGGRWRVGVLLDRPVGPTDDAFSRVQRAVLAFAERAGLQPEHGQSAAHCYALPALGGAAYDLIELRGALFDVGAALAEFPKPEPIAEPTRSDRTGSYDHRLERARRYLEKMPGGIQGSGGSTTTFRAAVAMVRGFGLDPDDALRLLVEIHNPTCAPAWSERELRHKVRQAYQRARVPFGAIADRSRAGRAA
jgi:hypothetical protein